MARGVNKVILVGNVGQEVETKYMQSGNAVTKISIATSDTWKDKDGNQQERTEWHRVVFFNRLVTFKSQGGEKPHDRRSIGAEHFQLNFKT